MAELIDKGAFIEDIKTEIVNLAMDGLKGTPRDRSELYGMIDRINEQPTTTESEIRAKAIEEFAEWIKSEFKTEIQCSDEELTWIDEAAEQLKGEQ